MDIYKRMQHYLIDKNGRWNEVEIGSIHTHASRGDLKQPGVTVKGLNVKFGDELATCFDPVEKVSTASSRILNNPKTAEMNYAPDMLETRFIVSVIAPSKTHTPLPRSAKKKDIIRIPELSWAASKPFREFCELKKTQTTI